MPILRRKTLLLGLLLALVPAGIWLTLRWFEGRWLRPFAAQTQIFSGETLQLPPALAGKGRIRLVHFWHPTCPCNALNQQHLAELMEHFSPLGVDFYVLQKTASQGQLPAPLAALKPLDTLPGSEAIPASPALAIWDNSGQLAYFGPYSQGAVCNSANSFVEPILQALLEGRRVEARHNLAVGCFCDWQTH
ncbi:thiol-disulfide isomerase [Ventosimonas gracilis]|uniref:Thiol-disulfide isomerase n=1 Tax=Ventosimonas gracilis TaxID=1680762 RepID=A0A139SY55_9GAMM|nr:DUF6436 domain-containing protein [Ventosimonas gracilis]KXU39351.1 thiol-disulfide isomerase [Ventosimonas gracilis]